MSRRAVPESTAERNRNTLKQLVKLEANKSCSDCKRNKHPRWASWNLGIFICIRCSGIHRGMGTHISRVKSVDLDSWTDEQLQSMLKWGNARANKYWEAKLAPGHVPAEAKIENFIRTKYESKRWTMEGPIPDPSTLDVDGDDDVPLSVVKEKAQIERSTSQRASSSQNPPPIRAPQRTQNVDLFGDDAISAPARPSTGPPKQAAAPPPKAKAQPADSLLGLDFLSGPTAAPPARPSSNPQAPGSAPPRTDLKQSILSLYASKPTPPPQPQAQHASQGSFGAPQSPGAQGGFGGMNDAFASLSFGAPAQPAAKPSPFAGLDSGVKSPRATSMSKPAASSFAGSGSFFDAPTSPPPQAKPVSHAPKQPSFGGFNDFMSSGPSPPAMTSPPAATQSNDLFDLMGDSTPTPAPAPAPKPVAAATSSYSNSAFNLSQPAPAPAPAPAMKSPSINLTSNFDAWGSSNAWSDSQPTTSTSTTTAKASSTVDFGGGWGSSSGNSFGQGKAAPQVSGDEDFGDWGHASPVATTTSAPAPQPAKPAGGFNSNNDDLFSNVWQ